MAKIDWKSSALEHILRTDIEFGTPLRTYDGEGTNEATPTTLTETEVGLQYHENEPPAMVFDKDDDIKIGDWVRLL